MCSSVLFMLGQSLPQQPLRRRPPLLRLAMPITTRCARNSRGGTAQPKDPQSGIGEIAQQALAQTSLRSVWLRNSLRGAIGVAVAVLVAKVTGVQHGFWVVLGTLAVLRSNALGTGAIALRAIAGTSLGFIVGGALLVAIGDNDTALWIVLPFAVLLASYAPLRISFLAGQAAFTVLLAVLFNIVQPTGWRVGLVRVEDVAIGCAVSLVAGFLLWPRGAGPGRLGRSRRRVPHRHDVPVVGGALAHRHSTRRSARRPSASRPRAMRPLPRAGSTSRFGSTWPSRAPSSCTGTSLPHSSAARADCSLPRIPLPRCQCGRWAATTPDDEAVSRRRVAQAQRPRSRRIADDLSSSSTPPASDRSVHYGVAGIRLRSMDSSPPEPPAGRRRFARRGLHRRPVRGDEEARRPVPHHRDPLASRRLRISAGRLQDGRLTFTSGQRSEVLGLPVRNTLPLLSAPTLVTA